MKNADMNNVLKKAMVDFKDAYNRLVVTIDRYEQTTKTSVNDLQGFTESYPFDKSFDELPIAQWVDHVAEGMQQSKYKVLNYNYMNTGGNTMVGIFEVWLPEEKRVVYALTNEEGCSLSVVDYISNELDIDDYDELLIDYVDWGSTTGDEKYFELYRHCLNVYTKDDCRYFGCTRQFPRHLLSDELQKQITEDYQMWMDTNEYDLFETDGEKIIESSYYDVTSDDEKLLNTVKAFQRWHESIGADERYYYCDYTLTFADKKITLPFVADVWDAVDNMLESVIRNY